MKKTLLALFALALSGVAVAQNARITSASTNSQNMKVGVNDDGYVFNFAGTTGDNCNLNYYLVDNPRHFWLKNNVADEYITWLDSANKFGGYSTTLKFNTGDCTPGEIGAIEFTEAQAQVRMRIKIYQQVDLKVALNSGGNLSGQIAMNGVGPDADFEIRTFTFTATQGTGVPFTAGVFSQIEGINLEVAYYPWPQKPDEGKYEIDWIEVGAAVGTSTADGDKLDASVINVYPTPAADVLNVDLSKLTAGAELKLVSSNGQTVYTTTASNSVAQINVADYTSGLYALQITSNGKTTTKKVVIK
jgi:hypothetical protein